jgi:hypothetical protein
MACLSPRRYRKKKSGEIYLREKRRHAIPL